MPEYSRFAGKSSIKKSPKNQPFREMSFTCAKERSECYRRRPTLQKIACWPRHVTQREAGNPVRVEKGVMRIRVAHGAERMAEELISNSPIVGNRVCLPCQTDA